MHSLNRYCNSAFVLVCNTISSAYAPAGIGSFPSYRLYPLLLFSNSSISGFRNIINVDGPKWKLTLDRQRPVANDLNFKLLTIASDINFKQKNC